MKTIFSLIVSILFSILAFGQEWAPIGATWYYEVVYPFSSDKSYVKYESVGDTVILGTPCRIIALTEGEQDVGHLLGNSDTAYTYQENGKIFVFDPMGNSFSLIYDFDAEPDETWVTTWDTCSFERVFLMIDTVNINGFTLKSGSTGGFTVIEGIGGERSLFGGLGEIKCEPPDTTIADGPFIQGLRCYSDSNIGFYSTGISPSCDFVGIDETNDCKELIIIYPNPTTKYLMIDLKNKTAETYTVNLITLLGENIKKVDTKLSKVRLSLEDVHPGLYFISVSNDNEVKYTGKVVIR